MLLCFSQLSTVETDATVDNTDEDIIGETVENTVPLSNNSKRSMTLFDTEDNSASEDYFPPLKRFQTCSSQLQYEWSLLGICFRIILKHFHSFIPDTELEDSILKYNPIPGNVPPPAPLDKLLRGVLEENQMFANAVG